ncbi:MAG: hypothetical protein SO038_00105 [Campylobacter sp.]|nr:hypothetical protein [Campylobacter sp.]
MKKDTEKFYDILERLEMCEEQQTLEKKLNELQVLARNIYEPTILTSDGLTKCAITELNKLIVKEIE